jgi:acetyl esterase/lipase
MSDFTSIPACSSDARLTTLSILVLCLAVPLPIRAQDDFAQRTVLFTAPGMEQMILHPDMKYKTGPGRDLHMDLYYPPGIKQDTKPPVVVFVFGYSDAAATKLTGVPLKDMGAYTSWARLVASSGMVGITYETDQPDSDLSDLIRYLQRRADDLGIDASRIGLWSSSGNSPLALSYLMQHAGPEVRTSVFYYGLMPTPDRYQGAQIDSLAQQLGFIPYDLDEIRTDVPLLIVRAGQDNLRQVNASVDHFAAMAFEANVPLTVINYSDGQHGFDILDDTPTTQRIIRQTLNFLATYLLLPTGDS